MSKSGTGDTSALHFTLGGTEILNVNVFGMTTAGGMDALAYTRDGTNVDSIYADKTTTDAHIADTSIHFADAPSDGTQYARKDGGWEAITVTVDYPLLAPDGTLAAPSYSFGSDSGAGLSKSGSGDTSALHFTLGGTEMLNINVFGVTTGGGMDALAYTRDGTNLDAIYADKTTADAHYADTSIHYADAPSDGTQYARRNAGWEPVVADTQFPILAPNGSQAAPSYSFSNNSDTGIYYTLNALNVSVNDVLVGSFNGFGFTTAGGVNAASLQENGTDISSTYETIANVAAHTGDGSIHFADTGVDGKEYLRKDNGWVEYVPGTTEFPLEAPDGSLTAPSYSFTADTGAGISHSGTPAGGDSALLFSINTNEILNINAFGLTTGGSIDAAGYTRSGTNLNDIYADKAAADAHYADTTVHYDDAPSDGAQYARRNAGWEPVVADTNFPLHAPDDTAAAPSYSWTNMQDAGLYRVGSNLVGVSVQGSGVAQWANNLFTSTVNMRGPLGAVSSPTFSFNSATTSGMYYSSGLRFSNAGVNSFTIGASQLVTSLPINMSNTKVINLQAPTADDDAATKKYVDDEIAAAPSARPIHAQARVAANGTFDSNDGFFSITRSGTGKYDLTLNVQVPFSSDNMIIMCSGTSGYFAAGGEVVNNFNFTVQTVNVASGDPQDANFFVTVYDIAA
jgi:hypothetical protein